MFRRWLTLLGSTRSLGLLAWVMVTPIGVIAATLADTQDGDSSISFSQWLLIGLVAQVPMGIVMLLGGAVASRLPWPRTASVLIALAAGAVRGWTIVLLSDAGDSLTRIVASAVTMAIWLQVIGAALESHDRFRRQVDELLTALVARELQGRLLDDATTRMASVETSVRIAETSGELRSIVDDAADDHRRTAALLQSAIETKLRPLSHDLWFRPSPVPPVAHRGRDLVRRILETDVPVTTLSVAAIALLAWGSLILHGEWKGALVGISVGLAYSLVLVAAHGLRLHPGGAATVRYLGAATLPALAGSVAIAVLQLGHASSPFAVALGLPLITLGVASGLTLTTDRAEIIADLKARIAEPDWDRHLGELTRRQLDTHAASTLHNSLQPALTAAALQLQLAAALDDPQRARDALERAVQALDEAQMMDRDANAGRERLERVANAWAGIAEVTVHRRSDVAAADYSLLADAIDESIANAVRHGHATVIEVTIEARDDDLIVEITDNGLTEQRTGGSGMGLAWLATTAGTTSMRLEPDGRRTRTLAFARTAH